MNTSNKPCILSLNHSTADSSLQFDPAPREGEPQVSRRTPGYSISWNHVLILQTTSSNAYPLFVEVRICLETVEKREKEIYLVL
jgi:hypothetical protein